MSANWIAVNHTKRQKVDPEAVGTGGIKEHEIVHGRMANLFAYLMMNEWQGDHVAMIPDGDLERLAQFEAWPDIARDAIESFNRFAPPYAAAHDAFGTYLARHEPGVVVLIDGRIQCSCCDENYVLTDLAPRSPIAYNENSVAAVAAARQR